MRAHRSSVAGLAGTDIRVPPLEAYAGKLWDYWERHLDPDLFRDRTLLGAARGRLGLIGGVTEIVKQQVPDELMRLGRRLQGVASLQSAVQGKDQRPVGGSCAYDHSH